MQASSVSESVYRSWYYGRPADVEEMGTLYFWSPSLALVTDNVVFGYNGPLSGTRSRFEVAHSFGDLISTTGLVDWRHYTNLRQRYIIGARVIGALSDGRDAEVFRVGGPFTFRGSDWGTLVGSRILISNLEFRYPLIDHLAIVWPLALDFRGIQGVLFFDTATVWSSGRVRLWSEGHLHDIRAAYGFGARLNLGIMNLRYDMAQATDLSRQIGDVRHFFTIGYDF
jgi:outer membrane protein assembly factor BamA